MREFVRPNAPSLAQKSPKNLVTDAQLDRLLQRLDPEHQTWLAVLILSGRRQGDLKNITRHGVTNSEGMCYVILPKDKMSQNSLVAFNFEWKWNLKTELRPLRVRFFKMLQEREKPFENINIQRVRRLCEFRLHALRNRKAIQLAIDGYSDDQIMSNIGWACKTSLLRYTQVPTVVLRSFSTYDEALEFINK